MFLFFFCCISQSIASCCSDFEYKLSKVLLHCYFRQSYPLEKYNRDLTACWFYSPVIKGQTTQKETYHWMPCHVFQYYKMILALIFSTTLFETSSEAKRKKIFLFWRMNIQPLFKVQGTCDTLCYFLGIYCVWRRLFIFMLDNVSWRSSKSQDFTEINKN